jgi:peptidyl-prolyl cis-trans isomerase A (cyclophilin A)
MTSITRRVSAVRPRPGLRYIVLAGAAAAMFSGCAPLHRAQRLAIATHDTLAFTRDSLSQARDSLSMARGVMLQMDSLIVPLSLSTPDSFVVAFETTKGRFDVMAHSNWAPVGVDRFYDLVHRRYYDDVIVFRVVKGFVAQFGISGDPAINAAWRNRRIADDRTRQSNTRGRVSFASGGPNTRTVQLFINFGDNHRLDSTATGGYPPIGEVISGMEVVDSLNNEYGGAPSNNQSRIERQGNAYLRDAYPNLDAIKSARIIREWRRPRTAGPPGQN